MLQSKRNRLSALLLACGLAVATYAVSLTAAGRDSDIPAAVVAGAGWNYRVVAEGLAGIDNLVLAADGSLYATQELPRGAGKVIQVRHGEVSTVVSGLNVPDGLLLRGKFLFITEETSGGRLLEFDLSAKKLRVITTQRNLEGIDMLPGGDLVVSEDIINGRLLRVRRHGPGPVEVLFGGLNRPEGLVVRSDGAVLFAETATGRVLSYKNGDMNVVLDDLDEPDQVEIAPDGALWITEDVSDARLLRLKGEQLEIVLSGLHYPQGMAFGANGAVWLAEQGRQRILVISGKNER